MIHTCEIHEGSGTYKFLLGQAIHNDVTSSNYVSFSSQIGSKRLWKYLKAAAPQKLNREILRRSTKDGCDVFQVLPADSTRCAGMISDTVLYPGQEMIIEADAGVSGVIEAFGLPGD